MKQTATGESVWLSADEAAERLGISKSSLYAYVSRGRITRKFDESGRRSRFDAREIAALASGRSRPSRPGNVELKIGTAITRLDETSLSYRGQPISSLVGQRSFEEVAELLWRHRVPAWEGTDPGYAAAANAWASSEPSAGPGATATSLARAVLAVGGTDEYRGDLRPETVVASVARLIGALSGSLPGTHPSDGSVAARLWRHAAGKGATPPQAALVEAALVALADHELATSTFAVRLAASTRADPYAALAAGLCVLSGPMHGSVSADAFSLLESAHESGRPARALGERLASGALVPGFGHKVYQGADPRFVAIVELLRFADVDRAKLATFNAVLSEAAQRIPKAPNVDFALAAMSFCCDLRPSTGELVFAIARIVGWTAHYLEELEEPVLRYRVRASYRGQ